MGLREREMMSLSEFESERCVVVFFKGFRGDYE